MRTKEAIKNCMIFYLFVHFFYIAARQATRSFVYVFYIRVIRTRVLSQNLAGVQRSGDVITGGMETEVWRGGGGQKLVT